MVERERAIDAASHALGHPARRGMLDRPAAPVFRAPMRARDRDAPPGAGAEFGVEHGLVGIGDRLPHAPASLDDAVEAASRTHGEKAGRMLRRFAEVRDGALVWTRSDAGYFLGRIAGPWRYEDSPVGIHHVRPATWLDRPFGEHEVPAAVADAFRRGGRNFQRTHSEAAERRTAELWSSFA